MLLVKENDDGSSEYIKGVNMGFKRDTYLEVENLIEGDYLLVAELESAFLGAKDESFVLTCYG
jgi:hypothetical protein